MNIGRETGEVRLVASEILLFCTGASLGAFLFLLGYDHVLEQVTRNTMEKSSRNVMLASMALVGLVFAASSGVYLVLRRFSAAAIRNVDRAARISSPLLLAFPLPVLFDYRFTQRNEWAFVLAAALFGLALERSLRASLSAIDWTEPRMWFARFLRTHARLMGAAPGVLLAVLVIFAAGYLSFFTILNHYRLGTSSWDLAIFDNMMWQLIRGSWFHASPVLGRSGSHIQFHANFIAYLYAPFYALYQHAESLLVIQSVSVASAAIPIYLLAKHRLGNAWAGLIFAYAYLLHAPMHGPVFYDFHFFTLAPFWVAWVIYFFETERKGWLVVTWILALLLREEISSELAAAALFYFLSGKRTRWAIIGGVISAIYFVVVKFMIMPLHRTWSDANSFTWIFQGLIPPGEGGFIGVLRTVISNPIFTFNSLLEQDKLTYVIKMMGPVLLLPLRHPRTWVLFIPPAMFTLLSTGYKPLYQTLFQYTSNYTPFIFIASIIALSWWRDTDATLGVRRFRVAAGLLAMAATATVFSYSHGAILQRNSFVGGFRQVGFEVSKADKKRHRDLYELIAMIPPDASVAATEMEAPHVSNRRYCFTLRFAYDDADYLLMNTDEARGGSTRDIVSAAIKSGKYGFVTKRSNFALWKRGYSTEKNDQGKSLIGLK